MSRAVVAHTQGSGVARTIRFPTRLRDKIAADAKRCGRSFAGQVLALLRRHYGEDVDIAPRPAEILALAAASLADIGGEPAAPTTRQGNRRRGRKPGGIHEICQEVVDFQGKRVP